MSILTYNGQNIEQRNSDGLVNLTQMCVANGKKVNDFSRSEFGKEYLKALQELVSGDSTFTTESKLIYTESVGFPAIHTTWGHPLVALALGQWISPSFHVWCNIHIQTLITTGQTQIDDTKPIKGLFERLKVILERTECPKGYWIIGTEIQDFLSRIEDDYQWSEKEWFDLIDNSVGLCWANRLRATESAWLGKRIHVPYQSPIDPKLMIWAYPYEAWAEFKHWFDSVYELTKFPEYIKRKQKLGQLLPAPQLLLK